MADGDGTIATYRGQDGREQPLTARDLAFAGLVRELDNDPKTRGTVRSLIADKFPDVADMMPETAAQRALQPKIAELDAKIKAFDERQEQERVRAARGGLHAKFRSLGIHDSEIPAVEKYMTEHLTADPELAVMGYQQAKKVATPGPSRGWGVTLPGASDSGNFFQKSPYSGVSIAGDWQRWRRERAEKDFADLAAGRPLDPVEA